MADSLDLDDINNC